MKRIMKVTVLTACVGTMLCFVGCGKGGINNDAAVGAKKKVDSVEKVSLAPAEELIGFTRKIIAELAKHGVGSPISEEEIAEIKKLPSEDVQKALAKVKSSFPLFLSYSSIVKEINDRCKKMGGNPLVNDEDLAKNFDDFLQNKSTEEQREAISEAQDLLKRLQAVKD